MGHGLLWLFPLCCQLCGGRRSVTAGARVTHLLPVPMRWAGPPILACIAPHCRRFLAVGVCRDCSEAVFPGRDMDGPEKSWRDQCSPSLAYVWVTPLPAQPRAPRWAPRASARRHQKSHLFPGLSGLTAVW